MVKASDMQSIMEKLSDKDADTYLVEQAQKLLTDKLRQGRAKGRVGWHKVGTIDNDRIWSELKYDVENNHDPLDIAAFALMMVIRKNLYGKRA